MKETQQPSRSMDITPPAVTVRLEAIKPEEGSWAHAVGARGNVFQVQEGTRVRGVVFETDDGWQIAASGHQRYMWPGNATQMDRATAIWFLCMANRIVVQDSPKYKEGNA